MAARDCECIPESNVLFGPGRGPSTNSAKFTVADKPRVLRLFDSSGDACVTLYTCTTVCGELFSAPAIQNGCQIELNNCSTEVMLYVPGNYYAVVEGADPEDIVLEHNQIDTQVSFSQNGAANMSCNKIEYACDPLTGAVILSGGPNGPCMIQPGGGGGTEVSFTSNGDGTTTLNVGGSSVVLDADGVDDLEYDPNTGKLWITLNDGTEHEVTLPLTGYATSTVPGMVRLAVEGDYPQHTNDTDATTPAYVRAAVLAAIPTVVQTGAINVTSAVAGEHTVYTVDVDTATATTPGVVSLATSTEYPESGDTQAVTPAYLAAAIAALPGDKFLAGLQSYNAATNTMTLLMNDGSIVVVDMTGLLNDALATIPDWVPQAVPSGVVNTDWGLGSLVNAIDTAAMTEAEVLSAPADLAATSVGMMRHVLTNRAAQGGDAGMRNDDGSMGSYTKGYGSIAAAINGGNFGAANVQVANGTTAIPDGNYGGQMLALQMDSGAGEQILTGNFRGVFRKSNHAIEYNTLVNDIIVRPTEMMILRWAGTAWLSLSYNRFLLSGSGWHENENGTVTAHFSEVPTPNVSVPAGQELYTDIPLPLQMNTGNYQMQMCDRNGTNSATVLGVDPTPLNGQLVGNHFILDSTTTKARISLQNVGGSNQTPGVMSFIIYGVPDYAALGLIASF